MVNKFEDFPSWGYKVRTEPEPYQLRIKVFIYRRRLGFFIKESVHFYNSVSYRDPVDHVDDVIDDLKREAISYISRVEAVNERVRVAHGKR